MRFRDPFEVEVRTTGVAQNHSFSSEGLVGIVVRDSRIVIVLGIRCGGRGGGAGPDPRWAYEVRSELFMAIERIESAPAHRARAYSKVRTVVTHAALVKK